MAQMIDFGGDAGSNFVSGVGTNSAVFTLPSTVGLKVESVLATVDNAAGADTTAKVTIRDSSGAVIATNKQGETIPAGDTGTATFALRVVDSGGGIKYNRVNSGGWLFVKTTTTGGPDAQAVVFQVPDNALFQIEDAHGNVIFDAGTGLAGDYGIDMFAGGSGSLQFTSGFERHDIGGGIFRVGSASLFDVQATQFSVTTTGAWGIINNNCEIDGSATGAVFMVINSGQSFTVQDENGNPLFRVDGDGDLHGKTGKALVFDL